MERKSKHYRAKEKKAGDKDFKEVDSKVRLMKKNVKQGTNIGIMKLKKNVNKRYKKFSKEGLHLTKINVKV